MISNIRFVLLRTKRLNRVQIILGYGLLKKNKKKQQLRLEKYTDRRKEGRRKKWVKEYTCIFKILVCPPHYETQYLVSCKQTYL